MNLAKEIRRTILNGRSRDIQKLLLSHASIELYRSINLGDISTSSQLSKALNVSNQNAHCKLDRLYQSGYVQRTSRPVASGRIEYVYTT